MTKKQQAIDQIISLMKSEEISLSDITNALSVTSTAQNQTSNIMRVLGYLGGLFVLTGLAVFITTHWTDLNSLFRVLVTAGIGFLCYLFGVFTSQKDNLKISAAPLFILAALLEPLGLFVFLHEYFQTSTSWEPAAMFVFGILLVQYGITFWGLKLQTLLFFSIVFITSFSFALLQWCDFSLSGSSTILGLLLLAATIYIDNTPYKTFNPFWYLISSIMFLSGLFCFIQHKPYEFIFIFVGCILVCASIWVKSRLLLLVSTVSIFSYIGYYTEQHFVNSIGWPLALIGLGLLLFILSALAYKLNRLYIEEK